MSANFNRHFLVARRWVTCAVIMSMLLNFMPVQAASGKVALGAIGLSQTSTRTPTFTPTLDCGAFVFTSGPTQTTNAGLPRVNYIIKNKSTKNTYIQSLTFVWDAYRTANPSQLIARFNYNGVRIATWNSPASPVSWSLSGQPGSTYSLNANTSRTFNFDFSFTDSSWPGNVPADFFGLTVTLGNGCHATFAARPTPTRTATRTSTKTLTPTWTSTATSTSTYTPTVTFSATPTITPTRTFTPTPTFTPTVTPSNTRTPTPTWTPTFTPTVTASYTPTSTSTITPANTITITSTSTKTATFTTTRTNTPTQTPSRTPTWTLSIMDTSTATGSNQAVGVAIAAGGDHTCALTNTGGVQCWGDNENGELGDGSTSQSLTPVDVSGLASGVTAIAAGSYHSCALTTAGGVECWGDNGSGQLGNGTTTQSLTPVDVSGLTSGGTAIAAGYEHSCALTTSGGVMCWGDNTYGELGDGTTTQSLTPVAVSGLTSGVTAIAAGNLHTCALTTAGGVECWGYNGNGQLGDGTTTQSLTPVDVSGLASGVTAIAAGGFHTCALTTAGGVQCWGDNGWGQLGDGTTIQRLTPVAVSGLTSGVTAIAAGELHTCALTTAGEVGCWGANYYGQLGDGTLTNRSTPMVVSGLTSGVTAIAAGDQYSCALTTAGGVECWGYNLYGELGDGTPTRRLTPVDVSGLASGVTAISAGYNHTCAITSTGGVECWGSNNEGQLGDSTNTDRLTPMDVSGLTSGLTAISAGYYHTCALTTAGGVECWGENTYGQLGDGTNTNRLTPVAVSGLASGVTAIAAGYFHTCALTTAGGVECWGENTSGQLGDGTTAERLTPVTVSGLSSGVIAIAAGDLHACALTTSGGVECWGYNGSGQLGDGTTTKSLTPVAVSGLTSGVIAIAAGHLHTCALTTAGGVECWGYNGNGQLGDGTTTQSLTPVDVSGLASGVTAIAAGGFHTCALTTAGGVQCWGDNGWGQLGDGTTFNKYTPVDVSGLTSGATAIAVGYQHTCALTTAGGVECWGDNRAGELGDGTAGFADTPVNVIGYGTYPPTLTPTYTPTVTPSNTSTLTPSWTFTSTPTATASYSPTLTRTVTRTYTITVTITSSRTSTPTDTRTSTWTTSPTATPTFTSTFTPTPTYTPTETLTQTSTVIPTDTFTPTNTSTPVPNSMIVTNTSDSGPGSLRQAIADLLPGGLVTFDSSLTGQTILLSSTITLDKDIIIDGSGLNPGVMISGNNLVRVFFISSGVTVSLDTLDILNGYTLDQTNGGGGGIYNAGNLTINNVYFGGNRVPTDAEISSTNGTRGGALYSIGSLTVTNSFFENNAADAGAGIYVTAGSLSITNGVFLYNLATTTQYNPQGSQPPLASASGGAVEVFDGSTVTIADSFFAGNQAFYGGAISSVHSSPSTDSITITNSTFDNNSGTWCGGAICNLSTPLNITSSTFSNNSAPNNASGGAIGSQASDISISQTLFSGNTSGGLGGAIITMGIPPYDQSVTINDTSFDNNNASVGGAIEIDSVTLIVNRSTFNSNSASTGGAISINPSQNPTLLNVTNSTFYGNQVSNGGGGGAVYIGASTTTDITNSTFFDNQSDVPGGAVKNAGTLNMINSILAGSTGGDCYSEATINTNIQNLVQDGSCGAALSGDPMLGPLVDNGGPTWTMALLDGSPAIDAGDDASCPATDQRGAPRPQGLHCDLGAYEYGAPPVSTETPTPIKTYIMVTPAPQPTFPPPPTPTTGSALASPSTLSRIVGPSSASSRFLHAL